MKIIALLVSTVDKSYNNLQEYLLSAGFAICRTTPYENALGIKQQQQIDICIIDNRLQILDVRDILQRIFIRTGLGSIPIVVVGQNMTTEEIITYLDIGVDDVIEEGYPSVILARIKAILRRQ
jgi:DNA-binding response OmpR family regulator